MSKGSTVSQYGCSTFGALATEAQQKEEDDEEELTVMFVYLISFSVNTQTTVLFQTKRFHLKDQTGQDLIMVSCMCYVIRGCVKEFNKFIS